MVLNEIRFQPEKSGIYLGSPSIVRAPDGALVASHDYFGVLENNLAGLSEVYRSEDEGRTWQNVCPLFGAFWGALFVANGAVWHLSCYASHRKIVIRKSTDGGYTWTYPDDSKTGLLVPDGCFDTSGPVQVFGGRVYRAVEPSRERWCPPEFHAAVLSAPLDSDLLDADSWTLSNKLRFDAGALRQFHPDLVSGDVSRYGWLEGNVLPKPDGSGLCSLMRIHLEKGNRAALLDLSSDGREISFDPESGIIDFVGGSSKFTIRRDSEDGRFWCLSNPVPDNEHTSARNELVFSWSDDLRHWHRGATLLRDDSGLNPEDSFRLTGFQYPDWQIEGPDMIAAVRVSYRGANSFHNSNRITFHRVENFREKAGKGVKRYEV